MAKKENDFNQLAIKITGGSITHGIKYGENLGHVDDDDS